MRKRVANLDGGIDIRQPATAPSLRWPETGGTLSHWHSSRSARRGQRAATARLRNASARDVIEAAEDLLL